MTFDIDASSSLGLEIKVVVEATEAIGGADPEAQDEGGALSSMVVKFKIANEFTMRLSVNSPT